MAQTTAECLLFLGVEFLSQIFAEWGLTLIGFTKEQKQSYR